MITKLSEMTWKEVAALDRRRAVPILPTGAVEAHGPHLPLSTDRIIAHAMAEEGGKRLARLGWRPLLLPAMDYTAAGFAAAFPGTVSLRPETATAFLLDLFRSLGGQGFAYLVIANAHLDPEHLGSIYDAIREQGEAPPRIVFPDLTRKPWALRLGDEFGSGACHAGRYEGSVVLARRAALVHQDIASELPPNPSSLSVAIREGKTSFEEAGGPEAYFGDPAAATAEEGNATIATLGAIVEETFQQQVAEDGTSD